MSLLMEHEKASKKFKLGKRAISHPPAISELLYPSGSTESSRDGNREELTSNSDQGDDPKYPKGIKLVFITLALCFSVFIVNLDQTIIATAIPRITDEFNSLDDVGWYGSAYLLVTASFQLPYGKFYSILSIKWTFLVAVGIFEIGSLVCAVAPSSIVLIIGRAIAGLGCAGIFSGALIISAYTMPLQYRPVYVGMLGAISGIAAIVGPLLGGVFTDKVSWRWCFYINLPIGGLTIAVIALLTPTMHSTKSTPMPLMQRLASFDILGICCFIPSIICCLLALQWGGITYAWNDAHVVALFVTSFVLFVVFIGIQFWKKENATLPPRIIKKRSIAGAAAFSFTIGAAFFVATYYLPIWFQAIKGASAIHSGIDNLPTVLGVVIISIISGGMITACGYYTPFMIVCSIITAVGAGCLTTLKVDTGSPKWIGFQALFGFGIGFGLQQPLMAVQTVLDIADVPTGTAAVVFAQTLGGAIMLLTAQNIFQNTLISNLAAHVPGLDSQEVLNAGATELRQKIDPKYLAGVLTAYNDAIVATLYIPAAMAALSIVGALMTEWKSVKGKKFDMIAA